MTNDEIVKLTTDELKARCDELTAQAMDIKIKKEQAEYQKSIGVDIDADWLHRLTMCGKFKGKELFLIGRELKRRKIEHGDNKQKTFIDIAHDMLEPDVFHSLVVAYHKATA